MRVSPDVLELFVVGGIEVGLPGAEPGAAPVDLPHVREPGEIAVEPGDELERIAHEDAVQVVDAESLVSRLDLELHVAVGPEPERLEAATLPAVGRNSSRTPAMALPSISLRFPLLPCRVLEGFGIDEPRRCSPHRHSSRARRTHW